MKKILTLILVLAAVLSVSGIALADEAVTLDIANGSIEITATGYKQGAAAEETSHIGDYVISGTYELGNTAADANSNMIKISAGSTDDINVTLKNLAVKHHGSKNSTQSSNNGMISPLQVLSGTVNLTLVGDNTLIADGKCPGLYIKAGATAVINGTGTLKSLGAHQAAGIGAAADASGISEGAGSVIINSGTVIAEGGNGGTGIGAARSRSMESVMITGGHVTAVAGSGRYAVGSSNNALTTLTITGGTLNLSGPSGAFEATTKNITGGNFIIADTYSTVVGRDIAEIYFAGADEKTLVSIKEGTAEAWSAYCDENGMVHAYLLDNDNVSFTASVGGEEKTVYKFATGKFTVGAECSCAPTSFDWAGTADAAKVYKNAVTIPVTVDVEKCNMAFHKIGAVTWTLDSVKVGDEAAAEAPVYATADTVAGTVTLKPAAANYTVVLKATLEGYDELGDSTKTITVTADMNTNSIDIGNGPVTVTTATEEDVAFTYTQKTPEDDVAFSVSENAKVVIFGEYEFNSGNAITITNCSPTIVLEDLTIEGSTNQARSNILIAGTDADHTKLILSGTNTLIRAKNAVREYCALEIRGATLTIDCKEGATCNDEACDDKLVIEAYNGSLGAGIGTRAGWRLDNGADREPEGFTLNIDGGYIDVTVDNYGAAIGSGWISGNTVTNKYAITINDGYIKANVPSNGVAVGAGRSNGIPDNSSVSINGGTVEAIASGNGTSSAINAASLAIAGDADVTVKGNIAADSVVLKDKAKLDLQEKVGCTEGNPGGSISNGYVWEDKVTIGTVDVKVSGNASLSTEGGINGSLATSCNATAKIKGVSPAGGDQDVSTSVGGVSGDVTVGAGSAVNVKNEVKGEATVEKGGILDYEGEVGKLDAAPGSIVNGKTVLPEIIEGANGTFNGQAEGLPFTSNAEYDDFLRVEVDDNVVDGANYTVSEGSTVVTLKEDYLKTLAEGVHTLTIVSNTGAASASFTVDFPDPAYTGGSSYSGPSIWYIGGNSFGTSTTRMPTSVEIDYVSVPFTMEGSNIVVSCINPGARWATVKWNSTSATINFNPDANVVCAQVVIPKTGDMPIWAAIAEFLGF